MLLRVIGEREPELLAHTRAVAELSRSLATAMGLDAELRETVARAAELHDVGKVAVPDAILTKPGPLDEDEAAFMRRHTVIGESIIAEAPALREVAALVRASHERWDGRGYPDGLAGHEIPLGARIVAVCDAFSAMRQERPYGAVLGEEEALDELRRGAGSQFDPALVAAFCVLRGSSGGAGRFIRAARMERQPAEPAAPRRARGHRGGLTVPRRRGGGREVRDQLGDLRRVVPHRRVARARAARGTGRRGSPSRKRSAWRSIGSSRSFSPHAISVGARTWSRSTTRPAPLRIVTKTSSTMSQRVEDRVSSTASSAGIRCPRAMTSRMPDAAEAGPARAASRGGARSRGRSSGCA